MSDQQVRVTRPTMESGEGMGNGGGKNWMPWVVAAIVIIVIVGAVAMFRDRIFKSDEYAGGNMMTGTKTTKSSSGTYQAVFLTNGQVYFGKLSATEGQFLTLTDIYYLQVTQPPLQGSQQQGQQAQQAQPQISLVKLGNELHGPVDQMSINRDQVLFWEDMKSDSQVVTAIKDYKAKPAETPAK